MMLKWVCELVISCELGLTCCLISSHDTNVHREIKSHTVWPSHFTSPVRSQSLFYTWENGWGMVPVTYKSMFQRSSSHFPQTLFRATFVLIFQMSPRFLMLISFFDAILFYSINKAATKLCIFIKAFFPLWLFPHSLISNISVKNLFT